MPVTIAINDFIRFFWHCANLTVVSRESIMFELYNFAFKCQLSCVCNDGYREIYKCLSLSFSLSSDPGSRMLNYGC